MSRRGVDLAKLFLGLQDLMLTELNVKRDVIGHPGAKGEATEAGWRGWLSTYLPQRYKVKKAFVVDADGNLSDQIDIVIFDRQYTPPLLDQDGVVYVPAEGVYGVLEVKQELNAEHFAYAGQKAATVRRLRRTSAPIVYAGGTYEPRRPFDILAGVVTTSSGWNPALGTPLVAAASKLPASERLDLGCVLKHGAFEVHYDAGASPTLTVSPPKQALIQFFLTLLGRLQALGTVPAIDFGEYAHSLARSHNTSR